MGRAGVSEFQVFKLAEQLTAAGVKPTVDALRQELGNTGSRTTINNYLKAWREKRTERDSAGINLGGHLLRVLTEQSELLLGILENVANAKFSQKAERYEADLADKTATLQHQGSELQAVNLQLSAAQLELQELQNAVQRNRALASDRQEEIQVLRETLAKETGRREQLDSLAQELREQVQSARKELKSTATRNEILAESLATKTAELHQLQARDKDHRAVVKEKDDQIARLSRDLKEVRRANEKEIGRLSASFERLLKPTKRSLAVTKPAIRKR